MAEYIEREKALTAQNKSMNLNEMRERLKRIPAADVRPVVRGRWEDVKVRDYSTNINGGMPLNIASMFCPVCGRWHNEVYHYGNPTEMAHYCPNCGADMRSTNCTKTATADEEREVLNVRAWLNNGADMREES